MLPSTVVQATHLLRADGVRSERAPMRASHKRRARCHTHTNHPRRHCHGQANRRNPRIVNKPPIRSDSSRSQAMPEEERSLLSLPQPGRVHFSWPSPTSVLRHRERVLPPSKAQLLPALESRPPPWLNRVSMARLFSRQAWVRFSNFYLFVPVLISP